MNNVDNIRLDQFRQIREEIRGSKEYLIVGIDVAKSKHYAFFGTAREKMLLKKLIFENSIEGFEKLLTRYPKVDWKGAKGMRDIISHHYFDLNAEVVLTICRERISYA
jgi:transposase